MRCTLFREHLRWNWYGRCEAQVDVLMVCHDDKKQFESEIDKDSYDKNNQVEFGLKEPN